jgi:hypothetical protein
MSNIPKIPSKQVDLSNYSTTSEMDDKLNIIKDVVRVSASYTNPGVSITNVSQTVERGTSLSAFNIDINFVKNDAGVANGYSLEQDGVEISTTQSTSITLNNITSNVVFRGIVNYNQGDIKTDNFQDPSPTGRIEAGSITSTARTITTRLKSFYGSSSSIPTTSAEVRALPSSQFETTNTLNLTTGSTNLNFIVAIPASDSLTQVIDTGNLNANITSQYTLRSTFDVEDAGGNLNSYKIYAMTVTSPYTPSTNHQITKS